MVLALTRLYRDGDDVKTVIKDGEIDTHLALEGGDVIVRRHQDCQDIADRAKMLADQPQHGADFHHIWSLPNTIVENFYKAYCGDQFKPMDQNFWEWVNKQVKSNKDYQRFWTYNPARPFWSGYGS